MTTTLRAQYLAHNIDKGIELAGKALAYAIDHGYNKDPRKAYLQACESGLERFLHAVF